MLLKKYGILVLAAIITFAGIVSWAGSQHGINVDFSIPLFTLCAVLVFCIQWLAFIPALLMKTEHFYDLVGGLTYVLMMVLVLYLNPSWDARTLILVCLISIWALRLSLFLFRRISQDGSDSRFDSIKLDFMRFLIAWSGQGLWIVITAGCALAAMTAKQKVPLDWLGYVGVLIWLCGFFIEVVADWQKRQFKRQSVKAAPFISSGLWRYSRHPNYLGEIILWIGIALIALPALTGWQHLTLISPLFVILLLTKMSGIPLLEEKADALWQDREDYQQYKATTPVLLPFRKFKSIT